VFNELKADGSDSLHCCFRRTMGKLCH